MREQANEKPPTESRRLGNDLQYSRRAIANMEQSTSHKLVYRLVAILRRYPLAGREFETLPMDGRPSWRVCGSVVPYTAASNIGAVLPLAAVALRLSAAPLQIVATAALPGD